MGKTASVPCKACGALNDVLLSEDTFEENLRRAAFSFACRVCGAVLPDELPAAGAADSPLPGPGDGERKG